MSYCLIYNKNIPIYAGNTLPSINSDEGKCIGLAFDNIIDWKNYWINENNSHQNCSYLFYNMIYTNENKSFNQSGFENVSNDFKYIFDTYFQENAQNSKGNHKLGVYGEEGYDDFQEILINVCSNNPQFQLYGACSNFSKSFCQNCTPDEISSNTDLLKMCGCQISSLDNSTGIYDNVPAACDPLCNHEQMVKNINITTGEPEQCDASVCVINNISIVSTESLVGTVNFYQVCPQCGQNDSVCICILDVDISSDVNINNNVEFNQYCGSNSICLIIGPDGTQQSVPCADNITQLVPTEYYYPISIYIWFVIIFIIILFFLILFAVRSKKNY